MNESQMDSMCNKNVIIKAIQNINDAYYNKSRPDIANRG